MIFVCGIAHSEDGCRGKIVDVVRYKRTGSVSIVTAYTLNGQLIKTLVSGRYSEVNGTALEIQEKIQNHINKECRDLVLNIVENKDFLNAEKLKINKEKTEDLFNSLKVSEIGKVSNLITTWTMNWKGKKIELKADKTHTVTELPIAP